MANTVEELQAQVATLEQRVAELEEDSRRLSALEAAGVDNWSGHDYAMEILREWEEEAAAK